MYYARKFSPDDDVQESRNKAEVEKKEVEEKKNPEGLSLDRSVLMEFFGAKRKDLESSINKKNVDNLNKIQESKTSLEQQVYCAIFIYLYYFLLCSLFLYSLIEYHTIGLLNKKTLVLNQFCMVKDTVTTVL